MFKTKDDNDVADQLMDDEEMVSNWKQISELLYSRVKRSKSAHERDPGDARKSLEYLKRSKEFFAFSRLIFLFGKMTALLDEGYDGTVVTDTDKEWN